MTNGSRRAAARLGVFLVFAATAPAIAEDEVGTPQVEVEVRFLEVSKQALDGFGVNWRMQPLPPQAVERLKAQSTTKVLGETSTTTPSGQPGEVSAGSQAPPTPYHVDLVITPRVAQDGSIRLDVKPSVTQIDVGGPSPAMTQREPSVLVPEVEPGGSAAIGGLLQENASELPAKVPGLGDIPTPESTSTSTDRCTSSARTRPSTT